MVDPGESRESICNDWRFSMLPILFKYVMEFSDKFISDKDFIALNIASLACESPENIFLEFAISSFLNFV